MRVSSPLLVLASLFALSPAAPAQAPKLSSKYVVDERHGFRVKVPSAWTLTPFQSDRREAGLALQVESLGEDPVAGEMSVFILKPVESATETAARPSIDQVLSEAPFRYRDLTRRNKTEDEDVRVRGHTLRHVRWEPEDFVIDSWTVSLPDYDICMLYVVASGEKRVRNWLSLYRKSARTFQTVERKETAERGAIEDYDELMEYYRDQAALTPGWRALPTPSEKFVVLTSAKKRRFVDEAIERLERSREVFEQDFPPPDDFRHVSVVRLCGSEAEFHHYGNTRKGVAGWFNPRTTELVLFDAVQVDRNMTFAVMSHEAFHQYCHFLFGQSEAHRWFDEGHGDYYGGFEFKGKRATVTARMPGGLERYSVIREMIQSGTFAPLKKHLNATHRQWQNQGPKGVSCYAQSWSIVYMLRQGTLGKLPDKLWRREYADIIPAYVTVLSDGYKRAYAAQVEELISEAEENGETVSEESLEEARSEVSEETRDQIWEEAMEASWGQIDLDEFEEKWKLYVRKYLDD